MNPLSAREAYRLWAPTYAQETAVSFLENEVADRLAVPTAGKRLLDAGCGTARRLAQSDAAFRFGVDLTPEMLFNSVTHGHFAAANVNALPLRADQFDVVWCRLVLGHTRDLGSAYAQLARVCAIGGALVITDFHPAAAAAGHRRTFRNTDGTVLEVEHHVHTAQAHIRAATRAGLESVAQEDGVVGPSIRDFYVRAGRSDDYAAQVGLPLVLGLAFRKLAQ